MNQRKVLTGLFLMIGFIIGVQIIADATSSRTIPKAYARAGFELQHVYVENWAEFNLSKSQEPEALICQLADQIGLQQPYELIKDQVNETRRYYINKKANEVETTIRIAYKVDEPGRFYVRFAYDIKDKFSAAIHVRDMTDNVISSYGAEGIYNITSEGYYQGNLYEEKTATTVIDKLDRYLSIRFQDSHREDSYYNGYGYSWRLGDYTILKGEKINVDIGMTYDEEGNKTRLLIGQPVINMDY